MLAVRLRELCFSSISPSPLNTDTSFSSATPRAWLVLHRPRLQPARPPVSAAVSLMLSAAIRLLLSRDLYFRLQLATLDLLAVLAPNVLSELSRRAS